MEWEDAAPAGDPAVADMREALERAGLTPHEAGPGLADYLTGLITSTDEREESALLALQFALATLIVFGDVGDMHLASREYTEKKSDVVHGEKPPKVLSAFVRGLMAGGVMRAAAALAAPSSDPTRTPVHESALRFVAAVAECGLGLRLVPELAAHLQLGFEQLLAAFLSG